MGGNLLKDQWQGANYRGLPIEEKNDSSSITAVTGETVQFYYNAAGVRTIDAGQAAGVAVEAVLAKNNVKNSQGRIQATIQDTSLTFTSTAFTTEVAIDLTVMEQMDNVPWATRLAALTANLTNGQYVVDYSKGILYGKKASTQTTLTNAAYNINSEVLGSISIDEFPAAAAAADATANPTTTSIRSFPFGFNGTTWDRLRAGVTTVTATLTGWLNALPWAVYNATPTVRTEGQGGPVQADVNGNVNSNLGTKIAGENLTTDRMMVEQAYTGIRYAADQLVKTGAGFLHTLTFSCNDAAPTAGSIIVYDNTAESGTIIYSETFTTTAFRGYTVTLDVAFSTGLYIGFTTTADVNVTPSWR